MRPFALLAASLALVAVAFGVYSWLGRGTDDAAPPAAVVDATPPAEPAPPPVADAPDTDAVEAAPEASDADAPAGAEAAASEAALPPVPVPDGYVAVAPLVEERRVAFEAADAVLDPALDYAAVIETNRGTLVVDLFEAETPITVNNFVYLALHRYYDGIVFHRVIDGFMAQTGDPTGTGTGGPGYRFEDEIVPGLGHDAAGVLSMANAGPGTNGSQFFLTFDATPWLDGAHTVFGRVLDGLPVLDAIHRVDPQQPSAVALLSDPASDVRDQGIDLPGDGTVEEALTAALGAPPVPGPSFEVAGARVAIGAIGTDPAAGFFPFPDRMERVTIVTRPRE
jgi:cyclophilin family peptidyl-prolyl cis-trans isomerase